MLPLVRTGRYRLWTSVTTSPAANIHGRRAIACSSDRSHGRVRAGASHAGITSYARQRQTPSSTRASTIRNFSTAVEDHQHVTIDENPSEYRNDTVEFAKTLPVVCPGCGALSQTVDPTSPGFYAPKTRGGGSENEERKRQREAKKQEEAAIFEAAMARLSGSPASMVRQHRAGDGRDYALAEGTQKAEEDSQRPPICNRCHGLLYQNQVKDQAILHPSMDSIREIIESSQHRNNHIYHVLDAADFPMSLIPNLVSALNLPRLRTQNRRSKHKSYIDDRTADVSFIITRADLLAPKKEQVDRMMPYLQDVLRDALGRAGKNVRLTHVRCVSSKRGWWTPHVKEEIWRRGGAGWVVGKVNVGKSALFEAVYPKGRQNRKRQEAADRGLSFIRLDLGHKFDTRDALSHLEQPPSPPLERSDEGENLQEDVEIDDEDISLLPPAQPETPYPHMPIVSALPGTTASPIRIPYGDGKGELIDLPGIQRSSLATHIKPEHHASLVMKSRIVPEQHRIYAGRSLLIGGIIRITPKTEDVDFLAYAFTPLDAHAARNDKAIAIQTGVNEDGTPYVGTVENIGTDTAKQRVRSAGTFKLEWDATKQRTGSLTDRAAGKRKVDELPFIVYSADILIEGVGWVELACQVRSRKNSLLPDEWSGNGETQDHYPEVEVFTPKGKFVDVRKPMNAWITGGADKLAKHARRVRPRMSISYQRRVEGGKRGSR